MTWWNWWVDWLGLEGEGEPDDGGLDEEEVALVELVYREFPVLLAHRLPQLRLEISEDGALLIRQPGEDDPVVMNLPRMARRLGADADVEDRQEAYDRWLQTLEQVLERQHVDEGWAERLLVRLVTPEWVSASDTDRDLLVREVPGLGLYQAVVFDFPTSVQYVTRSELEPLGLSEEEAHARALDNLRDRLPADVVRSQVDAPRMHAYKAMDSYEAARILLIPDLLEPGESVAVAIPDRDSLVFLPPDEAEQVAPTLADAQAEQLLDRPVRVTCEGFERLG